MDYITIDSLRIQGTHGYYEHERQAEQEFCVSLKVGVDAKEAGKSDELADTIDYDKLRTITEDVFKGRPRYLIETLAEEIAENILKEMLVREVTISIQKTAVWPNGVPGVVVTRSK
jgi:dihydroneopterin aldolase